jgi:hypothetical protein
MESQVEWNPDIPGVHQDIGQPGHWPGDRRIQSVVGTLTESLCDVGCRIASTAPRQVVDRAVQSTVTKGSPLKPPEAVGEDTDEVGGHRLDGPSRTQAQCGEGILIESVDEVGDTSPLRGNSIEYLLALHTR